MRTLHGQNWKIVSKSGEILLTFIKPNNLKAITIKVNKILKITVNDKRVLQGYRYVAI